MKKIKPYYGKVRSPRELGELVRVHRKSRGLALEQVGGIANLGTRFLSEFERGKETAEIGKIFQALKTLGLELEVNPRAVRGTGHLRAENARVSRQGRVSGGDRGAND